MHQRCSVEFYMNWHIFVSWYSSSFSSLCLLVHFSKLLDTLPPPAVNQPVAEMSPLFSFFSLNVLDSFPRLLSWCLSPSHLRFELRRRGRDTRREQSRQQAFYSRRPIIRLPHCFTCSCACKRSWKLKKVTDRSSSLPQKTLLLVNALSVVLSLYLWLCYITLHHHVTHLNK